MNRTEARQSAPDWAAEAEAQVLVAAIELADELVWGRTLVTRAARTAGLSEADTHLLLPNGARDLAALLWRRHDMAALQRLTALDPEAMKVRERIRVAAGARVACAMVDAAATRAASLFLARPTHAPLTLSLAWDSADHLWRWAGDTATDESHYTKRAILGAILLSTGTVHLVAGSDRAERHLAARIGNVMAFEKWKARAPSLDQALGSAAAALGRIRYTGPGPRSPNPIHSDQTNASGG